MVFPEGQKDQKLQVGFNEKTAGKVLTLVKCKAKFTLPSLVLDCSHLECQEINLIYFFVFVSLQTWNICYLQWKIRSNTGKNFLTGTVV